jgi:hypothetical protein
MAGSHRAHAVIGAVALAGSLAACGANTSTPSTLSVTAPPGSSGAAPSALAPGAVAPTTNIGLTPNSTGPKPCAAHDLAVSLGTQNGAMGHLTQVIEFVNHSATACVLTGYPGAALGGGTPEAQIGVAANKTRRDPATGTLNPQPVRLEPDAAAHAMLQLTRAENFDDAQCAPTRADTLIIYPPDTSTAAYLPFDVLACAKPVPLLQITFVVTGM